MKLKFTLEVEDQELEDFRKYLLESAEAQKLILEDIISKGGLTINEGCWYDNPDCNGPYWDQEFSLDTQYFAYQTHSKKGKYSFNLYEKTLEFEGYRNSFGDTAWFNIANHPQKDDLLILNIGMKGSFKLKPISGFSSKPDMEFWVPVKLQKNQ